MSKILLDFPPNRPEDCPFIVNNRNCSLLKDWNDIKETIYYGPCRAIVDGAGFNFERCCFCMALAKKDDTRKRKDLPSI